MNCPAFVVVGDSGFELWCVRVHCVRTDEHHWDDRHHGGLFGRPSAWRGTEAVRRRW